MTTQQTQESTVNNTNQLHPFHSWELQQLEGPLFIERAEGVHIWDTEGNRYIDAIAGMWCNNIGPSRTDMVDAISEQLLKASYTNPFVTTTNPVTAKAAAELCKRAPDNINHVFFTAGGSTANDAAFRIIQLYNNLRGKSDKKAILVRGDAYHGSTLLTASMTQVGRCPHSHYGWDDKAFLDTDGINALNLHRVGSPNSFRYGQGRSEEQFGEDLYQEVVDKIDQLGGPDKVAAFVAEPVIGAGGVVPPPANYIKKVYQYCKANDILYWSDEVVTGFGRLGHFFASEEVFDIKPDIIISAKGLTSAYIPAGACLFSDDIWKVLSTNPEGRLFYTGYTYSGHPAACAAILKNIEIIEEEKICEHVQEVGPYFMEQLKTLCDLPLVGQVRGHHLMAAIELCKNGATGELFEEDEIQGALGYMVGAAAQKLGLNVRFNGNMNIFSPPLIITKDEIDEVVALTRKAIIAVQNELIVGGLMAAA